MSEDTIAVCAAFLGVALLLALGIAAMLGALWIGGR